MTRPKKDEKRSALYLVTPGRGEWFGNAGLYVGETDGFVVLDIGDNPRGFRWEDVEPIVTRETEST